MALRNVHFQEEAWKVFQVPSCSARLKYDNFFMKNATMMQSILYSGIVKGKSSPVSVWGLKCAIEKGRHIGGHR